MDKPLQAQAPKGKETSPPMSGLVELLRAQGFLVTTDDYVHMLKILELYGNEPPESLALRICPIIATTPEEQRRFYPVLADYFRRQLPPESARGKKTGLRKKIVWLLLSALFTLAVVFLAQKPRLELSASAAPLTLPPDSPYVYDFIQAGVFAGREADTALLRIRWEDSGRGSIGEGLRIRHHFQQAGRHLIRATASGNLPIGSAVFRQDVHVCAGAIETNIYGAEDAVPARRIITLHAASAPAAPAGYDWDTSAISGMGSFRVLSDSAISLRFDTPGIYSVRAVPRGLAGAQICLFGGEASIAVEDSVQPFEMSFTPGSGSFSVPKTLRRGPGYILLLCLAALGFWGFRRRRKKDKTASAEAPAQAELPVSLRPPYELPFPAIASDAIVRDKPLRRFLQLLRIQAEEETMEPDLPASIRASIRSGGIEELVLTPRRRIQEYLLFIDATQPHGLWHSLCLQLARWIESEGIPATLFFYDHDFQCAPALTAPKSSLRSIADNFPDAVPIIFGDGTALMHPLGGALMPGILAQLSRWETVLLITPTARADWGSRERLIARHLLLAPADAAGLQRLAQDFKAGRKTRWDRIAPDTESTLHDFKSIEGLRAYFSGDEAMLQWLCALCIYPKPRWELTIAFGKTVLAHYGRDTELSYDALLRLARIPWLAEGSFPQRLRMELLKMLRPALETVARAALLRLLREVRSRYSGNYLFSDEMVLQESLSGFVLFTHDPARFAACEALAGKFRALLAAGKITDVPARKYLEGGNWDTPLQTNGRNAGLQHYIEQEQARQQAMEEDARRKQRRDRLQRRAAALAGMAALLGIWAFLNYGKAAQNMKPLAGLYHSDSAQLVPLRYAVQANFSACGDSLGKLRVLPATLEAGGTPYGMAFDPQSQSLSARVPLQMLGRGLPSLTLGVSGSSTPLQYTFEQAAATGTIALKCREHTAPGILPEFLNEIWSGGTNGRLLNINLPQRMVYYSTGGPDTWGSYRIDTVTALQGGNVWRVVLRAYPDFAAMFISDASERGFKLAFCPPRWKTRAEALAAPAECAAADAMQLYYERDKPEAVLLPVTRPDGQNPPLQAQEANKIARLLGPLQRSDAATVSLHRYTNRRYLNMRDFNTAELRALLGTAYSPALRRMKSPLSGAQNPFRRETIRFELKPVNQTIKVPPKVPPVNTALPGKSDPAQSAPNAPDSNPATEDDINKWRKLTYSNDRLEAQQARYRLASYYMQQGDEKQAISLLQQNTASGAPISNWRISSYLLLADFYEKNGDRSQAMYLLERASKESLDPETTREIRSRLQRLQKAPSKKY